MIFISNTTYNKQLQLAAMWNCVPWN